MYLIDTKVISALRERILPVDQAVAIRAAALQVPDPMPEADGFIAATALVHRLTLVTPNVRDFTRTGMEIVNPWDGCR
jgi:predicted nucleic acid-binding protein